MDASRGHDAAVVGMTTDRTERGVWRAHWTLDKYHEDISTYQGDFHADHRPYETIEIPGNILVTAGIQLLLDLLCGVAATSYANANAHIGVGDSTVAAAVGQTDLQAATNKVRKAMDATFPSRSGTTTSWRSSFGGTEANFAWAEWAIFNAATAGTMLNRKVEALGTKASGSTWTLTASVTIS